MNSAKRKLIEDLMLDIAGIKHDLLTLSDRVDDEDSPIVDSALRGTFSLTDRLEALFNNRKTKDFNTSRLREVYSDYVRSFQLDMDYYVNLPQNFKTHRLPIAIYKAEKQRIKNDIKTKSVILKTLKKEVKASQKEFEVNNQQ